MVEMKVPEYRELYKNHKGYHYSYEAAKISDAAAKVTKVMVLLINDDYYELPEPLRIWSKWQDEEYD